MFRTKFLLNFIKILLKFYSVEKVNFLENNSLGE